MSSPPYTNVSKNTVTWRPARGTRQHLTSTIAPKAFHEEPGHILSRCRQKMCIRLWHTPKHGRRKVFYQGVALGDFFKIFLGGQKWWNFVFFHSKLGKQPFFSEISKFQGGLAPLSTPMLPRFLENVLGSKHFVCSATAATKTALGIIQLWFNSRHVSIHSFWETTSKELPR